MSLGRKIVGPKPSGFRQKINSLDKKYGIFKAAKFGIASASGFLLAEGILMLGVLRLYGNLSVPGAAYSSPTFLSLDILALALGVFLAFIINERYTVRVRKTHTNAGSSGFSSRLLRFEGVNAVGNAAAIGVQFALLVTLSITPVIGNVAGAIVAFPITYLVSMRFVWKPTADGSMGKNQMPGQGNPAKKKVGPLAPPFASIAILIALYAFSRVARRNR